MASAHMSAPLASLNTRQFIGCWLRCFNSQDHQIIVKAFQWRKCWNYKRLQSLFETRSPDALSMGIIVHATGESPSDGVERRLGKKRSTA